MFVAVDTETQEWSKANGLTPRTVQMVGMSVAYDPEWAEYWTEPERWKLFAEKNHGTYVFHHAKFDLVKLKMAGLRLPTLWEDTKIAATLVDENGDSKLKSLAKRLLGVDDAVIYGAVDRADPIAFAEYARNDARYTYRLWDRLRKDLDYQDLIRVYELEKAVVPVVQAMEERGMLVDRAELSSLSEYVINERDRAKGQIAGLLLAGRLLDGQMLAERLGSKALGDFNPDSPKQVGELLYDVLQLPCPKRTKKGQRSSDSEALSEIDHPLAAAILDYREFQKMATAFTEKLPTFIQADDRIHAEFNQLGAKATGRFSCKNPNLQQVPSQGETGKRLRRCFVAPRGHKLVVADYSQMELRVLAHYSGDPILVAAYSSAEEVDLHIKTASLVFDKPEADVVKDERAISKMANFAISYGITPSGLYKRLRAEGVKVSLRKCEDFVSKYFQTYKGVRRFLDRVEQAVKDRGYVKSLYGRRRRVRGKTQREIRQAQNFIIQGSAADLCKQALVDVHAALPDGAFIIAVIHDEIIVECRDDLAEQVKGLLVEMMGRAPKNFKVPLKVDVHIVDRWSDAK